MCHFIVFIVVIFYIDCLTFTICVGKTILDDISTFSHLINVHTTSYQCSYNIASMLQICFAYSVHIS